jgi:hypothetical protein
VARAAAFSPEVLARAATAFRESVLRGRRPGAGGHPR